VRVHAFDDNPAGHRVYYDDKIGWRGHVGYFVRKSTTEDYHRVCTARRTFDGWAYGLAADRMASTRREAVVMACAKAGCPKAWARLKLEAM
jgi:hypothetical protein